MNFPIDLSPIELFEYLFVDEEIQKLYSIYHQLGGFEVIKRIKYVRREKILFKRYLTWVKS